MAISKTPLDIMDFERVRAEVRADLEKFEALLQELREKYANQSEREGLMEEAARLFTRALDILQAKGCLNELENQKYKRFIAQVLNQR